MSEGDKEYKEEFGAGPVEQYQKFLEDVYVQTDNYLGEFLDGAEVAKVTLAVRTRYGSGKEGVAELDPQLYGIQFTAK